MKLKTMLLPTGEFALIVSNCPRNASDALVDFRKLIGATGVYMTSEDVEVEDALFDENARRADEFPVVTFSEYSTLPVTQEQIDATWATTDESWTAPGDENLIEQFESGAEFSPAGLVRTSERTTQDLLASGHLTTGVPAKPCAAPDPDEIAEIKSEEPKTGFTGVFRSARLGEPAPEPIPGEFGRSPYTGPQEHVLDLDGLVVSGADEEEPVPQVADRVEILVNESIYGTTGLRGQQGTVVDGPGWPGEWRVWVRRDNTDLNESVCLLSGQLRVIDNG